MRRVRVVVCLFLFGSQISFAASPFINPCLRVMFTLAVVQEEGMEILPHTIAPRRWWSFWSRGPSKREPPKGEEPEKIARFRELRETHGKMIDGMLDAIGKNPDDNTPRLILADLLNEQGFPEESEFIIAQADPELWRRTYPTQAATTQPVRRAEQLLNANERSWIPAEFHESSSKDKTGYNILFEKGFPDTLYVSFRRKPRTILQPYAGDPSLTHLGAIRKVFPTVNKLELNFANGRDAPRVLRSIPKEAPITGLKVSMPIWERNIPPQLMKAILTAPGLKLRSLSLQSSYPTPAQLESLKSAPWIRELRSLELNTIGGDWAGLVALRNLPLDSLEEFKIGGVANSITLASLRAIPSLHRITSLSIPLTNGHEPDSFGPPRRENLLRAFPNLKFLNGVRVSREERPR